MRECLSADLVALVKAYFSEEDRELVVDESLLPPRLANGVDQRQTPSFDVESALVSILQDERQSIGARSLGRYVGGSAHTWSGLVDEVGFPAISESGGLSAFSWVFVIREVFTRVTRTSTGTGFWKRFVHPPSVPVPVNVPRVEDRVIPGGRPCPWLRMLAGTMWTSSGMMGLFLYQELKMAISRQPIPRRLCVGLTTRPRRGSNR